MLAAVLAYGYARIDRGEERPAARIALIQGSIDITLQPDPDRPARMHRQYAGLSQEAVDRYGRVDLIVWPETVFGDMLLTAEQDAARRPADGPANRKTFKSGSFKRPRTAGCESPPWRSLRGRGACGLHKAALWTRGRANL